jgi:hypothetical protein
MLSDAFWYKNGKMFDVETKRHVEFILKEPEIFGITKEDVKEAYKRFNEKPGFEGKAREYLIKKVAQNGWIRVRHYTGRQDYWSIQYDVYKKRERALKDLIATLVLDMGVMPMDADVIFIGYDDDSRYVYSFQNGGIKTFLQERNGQKYNKVRLIENFKDFLTN